MITYYRVWIAFQDDNDRAIWVAVSNPFRSLKRAHEWVSRFKPGLEWRIEHEYEDDDDD